MQCCVLPLVPQGRLKYRGRGTPWGMGEKLVVHTAHTQNYGPVWIRSKSNSSSEQGGCGPGCFGGTRRAGGAPRNQEKVGSNREGNITPREGILLKIGTPAEDHRTGGGLFFFAKTRSPRGKRRYRGCQAEILGGGISCTRGDVHRSLRYYDTLYRGSRGCCRDLKGTPLAV